MHRHVKNEVPYSTPTKYKDKEKNQYQQKRAQTYVNKHIMKMELKD